MGTLSFDKTAGFSLVEACVALAIVGTLLSVSLPLYTRLQEANCWRKTEENQKEIQEALIAFCADYKHPPYAADETGRAIPSRRAGYIPYRTLGVPAKLARDGFNQRMGYALHGAVASNDLAHSKSLERHLRVTTPIAQGDLNVQDENGESVVDDGEIVAFVVVAGQKRDSPDEQKNWDGSLGFVHRAFSINEANPFRQKLLWISSRVLAFRASLQIEKVPAFPSTSDEKAAPQQGIPPLQQTQEFVTVPRAQQNIPVVTETTISHDKGRTF